ncbi:hemopexin [Sceloporus undulatus]|uniref:hemopexin n=1 Tax=Sceloporus undulatus TaxID=8520 RepID=UPI001C4AB199|nr:hemopexin [Sceloporus undulatus]
MLRILCLSWALALALAYPLGHGDSKFNHTGSNWHHMGSHPSSSDPELGQRCGEEGFDAITLDENGAMLFFQGDLVWKGFHQAAEPINASWPEIQGPIDAALRIHHLDHPDIHDNVYLFQGQRLWAYTNGKLKPNYPRQIEDEFKRVPRDLDAAVECHSKECADETLLFFKGSTILAYDLKTKQVKQRNWPAVANCSAAVRWQERYYCFQGVRFLRFDPVTGHVPPNYPRDARDYFMRCPGRGHGHEARRNATLQAILDPCSGYPFRAFSSDDAGRIYAFREGHYFRVDSARDGWHAWPLSHTWKELEGEVDAAFSWENKLYLIQGSQVSIYLAEQGYRRVEGYPRPVQEELGVSGADATFTCPHSKDLYVIQDNHLHHVDLTQSPRRPDSPILIPHDRVDSALCTNKGLFLFYGADVYHYTDVAQLCAAKAPAPTQNVTTTFLKCPMAPKSTGVHGGPKRPPH